MPFVVPIDQAQILYPEFTFISPLTPSEQKAAFHVRDHDGNDLCLKIISPDYDLGRLQREIIAMQSLSHPNIVNLVEYTFSSKPGFHRHYIIEEFIDGHDLYDLLIRGQQWNIDRTALFFAQLFDGLNALNTKNIVHRDLKPKNIRVRRDNTPVIIDFGLARHLSLSDLTRTSEGAAIGTPQYFAPEQFQGNKHDIDHRTDLYAAGTILYEALIGHHPYHNYINSYPSFMDAVCNSDDYKSDSAFQGLPQQWQLLINKLLEKQRAKRPLNAGQVASIIRKLGGMA
jgi:eukaryotic-like serine/threonine-protein kinase